MSLKTLGLALLAMKRFRILLIVSSLCAPMALAGPIDQQMPMIGGSGGSAFDARCAPGDVLSGLELTTGDDIDSVRPVCVTPASQTSISARHDFNRRFGGNTGVTRRIACPDYLPGISALSMDAEGTQTLILNRIEVYCGAVFPNDPVGQLPTVGHTGPRLENNTFNVFREHITGIMTCPRGLVAVGVHGRSGIWLDALGLICGEWPLAQQPPQSPEVSRSPITGIGRVGASSQAPAVSRSVCDAAADARARQSPAAVNLEAQCQAAGGPAKVRPTDADFALVRLRGEVIAANDERADNLRNAQAAGQRPGFDIGLGIWNTDVAPGPGKQRFHDFLDASGRLGFDIAATYALARNRHAESIAVATLINKQDAAVRAARASVNNGFYWLGFDIASGLFGPRSLGAQGSKVLGSGAIAIRNSLEANAQNGFNDSMALHLSRNYP